MRPYIIAFFSLVLGIVTPIIAVTSFGTHALYLPVIFNPAPSLPDGPLLLVHQNDQLVWIDPSGAFRQQVTREGINDRAVVSPDGQSILYHQENANSLSRHLLMPAGGGTAREVPLSISRRTWSPDSQFIAWVEYNNDSYNLYTYHLSTGITATIDTDADDVYGWHPLTNQLYFLPEISDEDVSVYRSNADGTGRILTLETPDTEWMLQVIPDGRVVVSAYNPERYRISSIQPDGTNYTLIRDLPRSVIVVSISPYGRGFFYDLNDVLYFDDITGQSVIEFTVPCEPVYESCSRSLVRWSNDELAFRWSQRVNEYEYVYTLYSLETIPGAVPHPIATGRIGEFQYSPDGRYLAYELGRDLVIYDVVEQQSTSTIPDTEIQMWRP